MRCWITLRLIITCSWINLLLVFVPVSFVLHYLNINSTAQFIISAFAIIPLAGLLSYGTEEVSVRFGQTSAALMNVTFGNATELIIFILALIKGEIKVVQLAIIGSVLSNLLLILGMAFAIGGLKRVCYLATIRSAG